MRVVKLKSGGGFAGLPMKERGEVEFDKLPINVQNLLYSIMANDLIGNKNTIRSRADSKNYVIELIDLDKNEKQQIMVNNSNNAESRIMELISEIIKIISSRK